MNTCAVIPAAGMGSRLSMNVPKLLVSINEKDTVWSIMRDKLLSVVDHINIIISPTTRHQFIAALKNEIGEGLVSLSLQHEPLGMGDAIFCAYPVWSQAQRIVVIWGDQVYLSQDTLIRSLQVHAGKSKQMVIPVAAMSAPYVEYIFKETPIDAELQDNHLLHIKQTREGDSCSQNGFSDVGCFVLSVATILDEWHTYLQKPSRGQQTGEINFLPFLSYLSNQGWCARTIIVTDINEARGINTREDLDFFQQLFTAKGSILS